MLPVQQYHLKASHYVPATLVALNEIISAFMLSWFIITRLWEELLGIGLGKLTRLALKRVRPTWRQAQNAVMSYLSAFGISLSVLVRHQPHLVTIWSCTEANSAWLALFMHGVPSYNDSVYDWVVPSNPPHGWLVSHSCDGSSLGKWHLTFWGWRIPIWWGTPCILAGLLNLWLLLSTMFCFHTSFQWEDLDFGDSDDDAQLPLGVVVYRTMVQFPYPVFVFRCIT